MSSTTTTFDKAILQAAKDYSDALVAAKKIFDDTMTAARKVYEDELDSIYAEAKKPA